MEAKCYLIIDRIDSKYKTNDFERTKIFSDLYEEFKGVYLSYTDNTGKMRELRSASFMNIVQNKPFELKDLVLSQSNAERAINFLKNRGVNARVQYFPQSVNISSNDIYDIASINTNAFKVDKDKIDVNFLKQYLKDVYTLEKEIYCSLQIKNKIANTINELGRPQEIKKEGSKCTSSISAGIGGGIIKAIGGLFVGAIAGFVLGMIADNFTSGETAIFIWIIVAILCGVIGFCMGFSDAKSDAEYQNFKYMQYEIALDEDNERVEKEKALISQYRNTENLYVQNITTCQATLKQLYSLDIIFPKYRNLIAISQIYEYFVSGRCTELQGHEGAYNIFESELRQNVIISRLDDVLTQLEQIKQNQYLIYQAIQEANSRLAHIESNTEAIKHNTAIIAENSAICARYADSRIY